MTQFLGDIAGMLEIFAIAAGFVLLHLAAKEPPAKLLKVAGIILIVGGIVVGACTSWYWFKYQSAGHFDGATPAHAPMEMGSMPGQHMMPRAHSNGAGDQQRGAAQTETCTGGFSFVDPRVMSTPVQNSNIGSVAGAAEQRSPRGLSAIARQAF